MKVKDKLDVFSNIALKEAEAKREKLLKEIETEFSGACQEITGKAKKKADEIIREESYKAQQAKNRAVIQASSEARHSLIELRSQLIDELFAEVMNKIADYLETEEYYHSLRQEIETVAGKYPKGVTVYLCPRDMALENKISSIPGVTLKQGGGDMLGGFTAHVNARNVMLDHSYRQRLAEQREKFNGFKITE